MKLEEIFDKKARKLKDETLSQWSAWRYSPDTADKQYTFTEMKKYLKNHSPTYIAVYFKDTPWGHSIRLR